MESEGYSIGGVSTISLGSSVICPLAASCQLPAVICRLSSVFPDLRPPTSDFLLLNSQFAIRNSQSAICLLSSACPVKFACGDYFTGVICPLSSGFNPVLSAFFGL